MGEKISLIFAQQKKNTLYERLSLVTYVLGLIIVK